MNITPAIDLIDGKCVRLKKGSFDQKTMYPVDPIEQAKVFFDQGVKFIHIVDLDRARGLKTENQNLIPKLLNMFPNKIQTGGGLRTIEDVAERIEQGAFRVVWGSMTIKNPVLTQKIIDQFGSDKMLLAMDCLLQDGKIYPTTEAWQNRSDQDITALMDNYKDNEHLNIMVTDIDKDGMLAGANLELYKTLVTNFKNVSFVASGGVVNKKEFQQLADTGVSSAIVGKAFYEGKISLPDLAAWESTSGS